MILKRPKFKLGDKVRCKLKDPFNTGDKNFHRRVLQITRILDSRVWVEWREVSRGERLRLGNWLPKSALVQAPVRKDRKKS